MCVCVCACVCVCVCVRVCAWVCVGGGRGGGRLGMSHYTTMILLEWKGAYLHTVCMTSCKQNY